MRPSEKQESLAFGRGELQWYDSHKAGIVMHENTRKLVEAILGEIRELVEAGK